MRAIFTLLCVLCANQLGLAAPHHRVRRYLEHLYEPCSAVTHSAASAVTLQVDGTDEPAEYIENVIVISEDTVWLIHRIIHEMRSYLGTKYMHLLRDQHFSEFPTQSSISVTSVSDIPVLYEQYAKVMVFVEYSLANHSRHYKHILLMRELRKKLYEAMCNLDNLLREKNLSHSSHINEQLLKNNAVKIADEKFRDYIIFKDLKPLIKSIKRQLNAL